MASTTYPPPQITDGSDLARFLQESYQNSFGDCPHASSGLLSIRIDDRGKRDVSPDFCLMSVLIQESAKDRCILYLTNPPLDDEVTELILGKGGTITGSRPDMYVEIPLLIKEVVFVRELAKAIRRIRRPRQGERYPAPNWWWVCPRTADSLDRLAGRLMEYRSTRRHEPWRLARAPASAGKPAATSSASVTGSSGIAAAKRSSQPDDDDDIFRRLEIG